MFLCLNIDKYNSEKVLLNYKNNNPLFNNYTYILSWWNDTKWKKKDVKIITK